MSADRRVGMFEFEHIVCVGNTALSAILVLVVALCKIDTRIFDKSISAFDALAQTEVMIDVTSPLVPQFDAFTLTNRTLNPGPEMKLFENFAHILFSNSHSFSTMYSSVLMTPSLIDSFGVQPSARIRLQSRKMNGLSP